MNDSPSSPVLLIVLVALLTIIAFSSGTEVAMLSVNRYRIRHRAKAGQGTAKLLERLLQKPEDWLGANLVILAAASVFASATATLLAERTGYRHAVPITGFLLTVAVIVFCELAPKIYAATYPESVALNTARIYRALVLVARPFLWVTNKMAYGLLRIVGVVQVRAREPDAEHRGAAYRRRGGGSHDPRAASPDAAVHSRPGSGHRERHHDPAAGNRRHRRRGAVG